MDYRELKADQKKEILRNDLRDKEQQHFQRTIDRLKWENIEDGSAERQAQLDAADKDIARLESLIATVSGEFDKLETASPKARAGTKPAAG